MSDQSPATASNPRTPLLLAMETFLATIFRPLMNFCFGQSAYYILVIGEPNRAEAMAIIDSNMNDPKQIAEIAKLVAERTAAAVANIHPEKPGMLN